MTFQEWLLKTKEDKPELNDFITKISSFFTDTGFTATAFEKKVGAGIEEVNKRIDESLKPRSNA